MTGSTDPLFLFQRLADCEGRLRGREDDARRIAALREALARIAGLPGHGAGAAEEARAIAREALDAG